MPIKNLPSLGPIFGLTSQQSDYAYELVYHGACGAWVERDSPLLPLVKAMIDDLQRVTLAQQFCVFHTVLTTASDDWEAPTLTGQPAQFAQAALASLRFDAHAGPIQAIDHVQIAIPVGSEDVARLFYVGVLGLGEVPKPPAMATRGGAWFEAGAVKVHLGVEANFRANDKAHVAFVVDDVMALAARASEAGYRVKHDDALSGFVRAFLYDPFGNRIEILRAV